MVISDLQLIIGCVWCEMEMDWKGGKWRGEERRGVGSILDNDKLDIGFQWGQSKASEILISNSRFSRQNPYLRAVCNA